jgi:hypothetical protein
MERRRTEILERVDPILAPLLTAESDSEHREVLETIVTHHARPMAEAVVRAFGHSGWKLSREDRDDIGSIISLRLVRRFLALSALEIDAIQNLDDYVRRVSSNTIYDYLRARYPERWRLKARVRYVLTRTPAFALWPTLAGPSCGYAEWRGRTDAVSNPMLVGEHVTPAMRDSQRPRAALSALFDLAGGPLLFRTVVDVLMDLWHVAAAPVAISRDREDQAMSSTVASRS